MAGVKISALPAVVTPLLSDTFPVVQAGVTQKESNQQVFDLFSENLFTGGFTFEGILTGNTSVTFPNSGTLATLDDINNFSNFEQVWADPNGSDVTGDGSMTNPYATIMFAQSTISDASSSKLYMIVWTGATATITTPFLKPFIFWMAFNNFSLNPFCPITVTNPITLDASFSGLASVTGLIGFYFYNAVTVANFDMTGMAGGTTINLYLERVRPYAQIVATSASGSTLAINAKYCDLQNLIMNGGYLSTLNCNLTVTTLNANLTVGNAQHYSTNDSFISLYSLIGTDAQQIRSDIHNASWPINQFTNTNIPPVLRGTNTRLFSDAQSYIFPNLLDTVSVDNSSFTVRGYNNTTKKIFQQEGFEFYDDVMGASTVNLNATYNNGAAGVGATLTNAGAFAAFNIDGLNTYTPTEVGMRFLIKNQTSAFQNGIYVLTTLGNGVSINWVLTRADDFNSAGAVFADWLILIYFGDSNANQYYRIDAAISTMGTDNINFSLLSFFDVFGSSSGTINSVKKQVFTSSGTYTPSAGMLFAMVEAVAGGGGGGGVPSSSAVQGAAGGAAGGGAYSRRLLTAAQVGASKTVTIGAGGTAGTTAPTDGGDGGDTSLGSLVVAKGGTGGFAGTASSVGSSRAGAPGGDRDDGTGDFKTSGAPGGSSMAVGVTVASGSGGSSFFGGGGEGVNGFGTGNEGRSYGGGASGATSQDSSAAPGGVGFSGIMYITEYCS